MKWRKDSGRVPILSWCENVETGAMRQAENLAALPVTFHHVALMPDCHVGYGMPIGGVVACSGAVIPNAVGVDIGCGVIAVRTDAPAGAVTRQVAREILERVAGVIPVGFQHQQHDIGWAGWSDAPMDCPPVRQELSSARRQLGTLGGGNHFIEIQAGDDGCAWLMIHSGSRNFGLKIAGYYHELAARYCARHRVELPSRDLAYLPDDTDEARSYLAAMKFALAFAAENRRIMMDRLVDVFGSVLPCSAGQVAHIHHNYCRLEKHFGRDVHVHRKGATSAFAGEAGVVPGSMGAPSYIVRGRANQDAFMSCSHGAGRRMGRNEANRSLSEHECDRAMNGVLYWRWGLDRRGRPDLSEAPQAYKDIDHVMAAQEDLLDITARLRPLGVIKG